MLSEHVLVRVSGWVPVEKDNKQYCWHSSVVDHQQGAALVLRPAVDDQDLLEVAAVPLAELLEETLELIGTNVNGNPYGEGGRGGLRPRVTARTARTSSR